MLGLGNSLAISQPPSTTPSFSNNYSLSFDGTEDYVAVPNSSDFDFGTGDFCWSFWVNYTTHTNYVGLFSTGYTNSEYRLKFHTSGQILHLQNADGDSQVADLGTNIAGDGWHHLLLNRVSGTIYTYLDGSQVDSDVRAGNVNSNGKVIQIAANTANFTLTGNLDEIALWKGTSLSSGQIATVYNSGVPADLSGESGLIAYWRFEEGTGTSAADSSENSNTGTLINGTAWDTDVPS
tara:strand:+ start:1977 stop:2684 length:708 start_codon:yes stop_codon:yes gene_type:complete